MKKTRNSYYKSGNFPNRLRFTRVVLEKDLAKMKNVGFFLLFVWFL